MKKPTNIKIKGKDGKEIGVKIDDGEPTENQHPYDGEPTSETRRSVLAEPRRSVNEDGTTGRNAAALIEDGILAKLDDIVARAYLTREIRTIDPNDPYGEGKLIAKAGSVTNEQIAAVRSALEGMWTRLGDDLILPPMPDALGFMRRANADLITNQMRTEMLNVAAKTLDEMSPEDSAPLSAWINDNRIENFREWLLNKGGWDKAIAERRPLQDELRRSFAGMPAGAVPSVDLANIKGDELIEWPIKYRAVQLAGSHTEAVEEMGRFIEGEPIKYLDALREAFDRQLWELLLKTASKDEKGEDLGDPFAWLRIMVRPYVEEQAAGMVEHRTTALNIVIRPKATTEDGDQFSGYPRTLSFASLMGGQFSIQANGENYFQEPSLAAKAASQFNRPIKQGCVEIFPKQWSGSSTGDQMTLALDMDTAGKYLRDPYGGPLEAATIIGMQARLPNMALKMFPVLFAVAPMSARWVEGRRGDWIPLMFPDYAKGGDNQILPWSHRRQKKRDLEMITAGFVCGTKGLQLKTERPNGSVLLSDIWLTEYDPAPEIDAINRFALAPWLAERMRGGTGGGFFLLNMNRWTTLGLSNPRIFPLALRLNSIFDEHRVGGLYDRNRVKPIRWDELARLCNMLPPAAEGRSDETIKARLRQSRAMMESDLKVLIDVGLLGAESLKTKKKIYGEGFEFKPFAPADYAEACERANDAVRKNQERKAKRKGRQG